MQSKSFFIVLALGLTIYLFMLPSIGFSCDFNKSSQFYYNCIVKKISKCQSKSMMLTSKSPTLREYALLNSQKAAFLENEKDRLIREMMERDVMLKDYQVEYYLNKRYNEIKKYFVLSK